MPLINAVPKPMTWAGVVYAHASNTGQPASSDMPSFRSATASTAASQASDSR
jgi:hypothetical protein